MSAASAHWNMLHPRGVRQELEGSIEVGNVDVASVVHDMEQAKDVESRRGLGHPDRSGPKARSQELYAVMRRRGAVAVRDIDGMDPVGVQNGELVRAREGERAGGALMSKT
jgi:hypothetical protein